MKREMTKYNSDRMSSFSNRNRALADHLVGSIPHGSERRPFRVHKKTSPKKPSKKPSPQQLQKAKVSRQELHQKWARIGLDSRGFVKRCTKVLLPELPSPIAFMEHPFFDSVPFLTVRSVPPELVSEMADIEACFLANSTKKDQTEHKYGANGGMNLGLSVVSGGGHSDKKKHISGSIHCSGVVKGKPELRKRLCRALNNIFQSAFGDCIWYRRMCHLTERLNSDSNEERTIPGIPASGAWISTSPRVEEIHCDENTVAIGFLFTTKASEGGEINFCTPSGKFMKGRVKPGLVAAGNWIQHPHCNSETKTTGRTAWTIYLDRRVFSSKYQYKEPVGFQK